MAPEKRNQHLTFAVHVERPPALIMINMLADNHIAEVHLALCMRATVFITASHVSTGIFL
jgi:hypothetical protein